MTHTCFGRCLRVALAGPLALGCLGLADGLNAHAAPAQAKWFVRLKVDDYADHWKFDGTVLGQQPNAAIGWDAQDLPAMPPFASPYLYLTFPRPSWGAKAGDYISDFRPAVSLTPGDWPFELRASKVGSTVYLRREGDPAILAHSVLIDVDSGMQLKGDDKRWSGNGVPVPVTRNVKKFVWRFLGL